MIRTANVFENAQLNAIVRVKARGWIFCCFIAALNALTANQQTFSIAMTLALLTLSLLAVAATLYYRMRPRRLNSLLLFSDVVTLTAVLTIVVASTYSVFADSSVARSVSRVGFLFVIPIPLALGTIAGIGYGLVRWAEIGKSLLGLQITEKDTYRLFFASSLSLNPHSNLRGLFAAFVILPLVVMRPILGGGGILIASAALLWAGLAMAFASICIRRYKFFRQSMNSEITII